MLCAVTPLGAESPQLAASFEVGSCQGEQRDFWWSRKLPLLLLYT